MKYWKTMSKRGLSLFLTLVMCLGMLNLTAFATEEHVHNKDGWTCTQAESTRELVCDKHVHDGNCYETERGELTCEVEEHTHDDDCYTEGEDVLNCEETEHSHGDNCYDEDGNLTCEQVEHTHDDSCYTEGEAVLTCEKTEHTHDDDCYATETVTTCTEDDHEHDDDCYTVTEGEWTCTEPSGETGDGETEDKDEAIQLSWDKETATLTINGKGKIDSSLLLDGDKTIGSIRDQVKVLNVSGVELGKRMFNGWTALTEVTLDSVIVPENAYLFQGSGTEGMTLTVTDSTIDKFAFGQNLSLAEAAISNSTIGERAFYKCTGLKKVTLTDVGEIGRYAFALCDLTSIELNGDVSIGEATFYANRNLESVTLTDVKIIGKHAFHMCDSLESVSISNCDSIVRYAFRNCSGLLKVSLSGVKEVDQWAFWDCTNLVEVSLTDVGSIGGGAFQGCTALTEIKIDPGTKLGYLKVDDSSLEIPGLSDRVEAILRGQFALDKAPEIVELTPDTGWDDSKTGKSENWNAYDNGTQIVEQARWTNSGKTEAEVKVDAYYTAEKQMDYIFVVDLSNSMTLLGNPSDMNARFYDMQSKLLDVSEKLLSSPGYDCRVAFVTFGLNTSESFGFYSDEASARAAINSLTPYYENTNYGLGLRGAKTLVKTQDVGRETTVVFISDGQPRDGKDNSTPDLNGDVAAAEIKELGVSIYGVLQSVPADEYAGAEAAMKNVCSDGLFFNSSDTQSFSEAVNKAIAAPYADYTVTIPVNPDFENVRGLKVSVSAGEARYDANSHTITWTVTGMPFTRHTLTYNMSLTSENAGRYGDQSYPANSGNAVMKDGASVETPVLTRSVSRPTTPGTSYYTLTVNYVYEDGSEAAGTVVQTRLTRGSDYSVTSPELEGYTPDQAVVSGTMPGRNVVVTVTYAANTVNLPDENPPLIDEPGTDDPTDNPPVVDLPDENPPLVEIPEVDPPLVDIPEEDPPLVDIPEEDPPLVDIPENDPPLVDVPGDEPKLDATPKTGDSSRTALWAGLCAVSLTGIAVLTGKKKEDEEA